MEKNIYQKLNDFRSKVGAVKKDKTNPHFKSKYATIESVIETIEKPLNECGLGYYQTIQDDILETTVFNTDISSEIIQSTVKLLGVTDMQKLGSAITYARRYSLVTIFGLEQEDDDGNIASNKPKVDITAPIERPKVQTKNIETTEEEFCEECGSLLTLKEGPYGKFWSCGNYPACKHKNKKPIPTTPKIKKEEDFEVPEIDEEIPF